MARIMAQGMAKVHALENLAPVSRLAVYVRAGSRYEPDHLPGISHQMRAAAGLTTKESSAFGITRHMERAGASFKVVSNREYIIYRVDCLRDKLDYVLGFIDDNLHKPEFRPWELLDYMAPRLRKDLEAYHKDQNAVTNEAMHKAAFRGGLAHSIYTPEHRIIQANKQELLEYWEKNFVLDRMTFTGLGCHPDELKSLIEERFSLNDAEYKGVTGAARYVGGGESRIQAGFPQTQVNYVVQSFPIYESKSLAALEVISSAIGTQRAMPHASGPEKSLSNLLSKHSHAFKVSIVNINYTDTGLFGISIVGPNEEVLRSSVKAAARHVKQVLNGINENDLKRAKKVAKVRSLIQSENHEEVFNAVANRHAAGVAGDDPLDLVESLTLRDVQAVAGQLLKSKPTLAAVGNPRFVPYIDELDN